MIHALVFETEAPFLAEGATPSSLPATARMAGLTLLRRATLMAWKAGAGRVCIAAGSVESSAAWRMTEGATLAAPSVTTVGNPSYDAAPSDVVFITSALVLPRPALLERLRTVAEAGVGAVAREPGSSVAGPLAVSGETLSAALRHSGSLAGAVRSLLAEGSLREIATEPGEYRHLTDERALAAADRSLYQGLTSISDGYIDRVFNRHISGWFTRQIINTSITPNQITYFHFTLGMIAAWLFWQGGYAAGVIGALLLQLSVALDCSDGEVARLKYQFSKFGSWLDVWADNVVHVAVFAAVARSAASHLGVHLALTMGALAVLGVVMCIGVIFGLAKLQERLQPGRSSSLAATNRLSSVSQSNGGGSSLVDRVINEATSRDFSVILVFFALIGKLEWFAVLAGVGSHIFWMTFAVIQLALMRTANAESR